MADSFEGDRADDWPPATIIRRGKDTPINLGVDLGSGPDYTVFRCTCGYRCNTARQALIHQHTKHGDQFR